MHFIALFYQLHLFLSGKSQPKILIFFKKNPQTFPWFPDFPSSLDTPFLLYQK